MTGPVVVESEKSVLLESPYTQTVVTDNPDTIVVLDSEVEGVIVEQTTGLYSTEYKTVHVVQGGVQGPPGVPGASTQFEYHTAGVTLGGNRAVTFNSVGQLTYPDIASPNSFVVGITTSSALAGELATVQIAGTQQEPSWNWTPGIPVFVAASGVLTQTPPIGGQVLAVGYSTSPTKIHIDKQPPIFME